MMHKGISNPALWLAAVLMLAGLGCQQASSPTPSKNKPAEQKPNKQPNPDPG